MKNSYIYSHILDKMALHIAKNTGANVRGITLSENQFKYANNRAQEEGLSDKVKFYLKD